MPKTLTPTQGWLADPESFPLYPDTVTEFGSTLIVAPHPDDETLGCGGAIALLKQAGNSVQVLVISDGTASHPNSHQYPEEKLRSLRQQETLSALSSLGVDSSAVTFLNLKDGAVPIPGKIEFEQAVADCCTYLNTFKPETIILPWRRDPHADHRASWRIIQKAINNLAISPRILEYPIWSWEQAEIDDIPLPQTVKAWRLDISRVSLQKKEAIAHYRSQTTDLINDDPQGFRLTPEVLAHFARPWEVYLEVGNGY
ncbi:MAG: PIG-L family deacetylase [Coleofasciculaceae cyanobacterium]